MSWGLRAGVRQGVYSISLATLVEEGASITACMLHQAFSPAICCAGSTSCGSNYIKTKRRLSCLWALPEVRDKYSPPPCQELKLDLPCCQSRNQSWRILQDFPNPTSHLRWSHETHSRCHRRPSWCKLCHLWRWLVATRPEANTFVQW